jgi:anaerobic magnesium-protoporphyrin IX monomethyl ester cyclase
MPKNSLSIFINPNLMVQKNDLFTTGIVYMPIGLASTVAAVRERKNLIQVIDAFGLAPKKMTVKDKFLRLGLSFEEIYDLFPESVDLICIFANQIINHEAIIDLIKYLKQRIDTKILILENTQAVTAYSLKFVATEFFNAGADIILCGEAEVRLPLIIKNLNENKNLNDIDGIITKSFRNNVTNVIENLDNLPFPAWDLFPLENYWKIKYAHGPFTSKKYLPILTSRGCPYPCKFCVVPTTNLQKWRARSPNNVVNEIEYFNKTYGVNEFHLEDLDSTVRDTRTKELCLEIINRKIKINWKIVAGTKVETIKSMETLELMKDSGCSYISISPESGSKRVLKLMKKPFNIDHAVKIISKMNYLGIKSQACFVLGYPGEDDSDLKQTGTLIKTLTKKGLDEIAIFIITPVPGSSIYFDFKDLSKINLSMLNFTPIWRKDYNKLAKYRLKFYCNFLFYKFIFHPFKVFVQIRNFFLCKFETKMEMVPYKALKLKINQFITLAKKI